MKPGPCIYYEKKKNAIVVATCTFSAQIIGAIFFFYFLEKGIIHDMIHDHQLHTTVNLKDMKVVGKFMCSITKTRLCIILRCFKDAKFEKYRYIILDVFVIFAQNIDCGFT